MKTIRKTIRSLSFLLGLLFLFACRTPQPLEIQKPRPHWEQILNSSVKVLVLTRGELWKPMAEVAEPSQQSWSGSAVVLGHWTHGGKTSTQVLTSHHVLALGELNKVRVDADGVYVVRDALFILQDRHGNGCELQPVIWREAEREDVATAVADCHLGEPANLADLGTPPSPGADAQIVGYPLGMNVPILTQGVISGYHSGLAVVSASTTSGNSGGGVWADGKLVGIVAQRLNNYPQVTFAVYGPVLRKIIKDSGFSGE